jgi:glycosyltransferase involved in cell wall biosynthesis
VLVPAWRAAAFIEPTLDSLAAQSHPDLEILISDDASPDQTAAICERYQARDPRFRVLRQPRNLGWTGNVNALLGEANGEYCMIASHDDLLHPSYLARCVAALEADPEAILAFSDLLLVKACGRRELKSYPLLDGVRDGVERARWLARRKGENWIPYRGVFRARAARAVGGLRRHRDGEFSADWPWLLGMSLLGGFARIPECLYTKHAREQGVSRRWHRRTTSWRAVTLSALGVVWRAELSLREKLSLSRTLATALVWRRIRTTFRSRRARAGSGPGPPARAPAP